MSRLADDLAWYLDALDEPPRRLHEGYEHVADGDHLGGPAMTRSFEAWLTRSPQSVVVTTDTVVCEHPLRSEGMCLACASYDEDGRPVTETGYRRVDVARYRWPMRAAMARVRRAAVHPDLPDLARTLFAIAQAGNLADAASVLALRWPAMGEPVVARGHMSRALRQVRRVFTVAAPLPRAYISDAQANAEAAGRDGQDVSGDEHPRGTYPTTSSGGTGASVEQAAA